MESIYRQSKCTVMEGKQRFSLGLAVTGIGFVGAVLGANMFLKMH
jgi:hypothetical protein